MCVCAKSSENFCVALVVPVRAALLQFAQEVLGKTGFTVEQLSQDQSVLDAVAKALLNFGLTKGLQKFEIPKKFAIVHDEWTPESNLVTAAMKLRRKPVEEKYAKEIRDLYAQLNNNNTSDLGNSRQKGAKISPI